MFYLIYYILITKIEKFTSFGGGSIKVILSHKPFLTTLVSRYALAAALLSTDFQIGASPISPSHIYPSPTYENPFPILSFFI